MKRLLSLILTALLVTAIAPADAAWTTKKPSKKKGAYTPPPAPTPTPPPSVDLSKFIGGNLEKILGPLDAKMPMPRPELAQIRTSISGRLSKASLAERPQYQAALKVCDALSQAMDERNKATLNPIAAANWPQQSAQLRQNIEQLMAQEKAAEVPAGPSR
jgi:hypothetical protein